MPVSVAKTVRHFTPPRLIALAIILLGFAASLTLNFPGHFGPDSLWQLQQGKSGVYNDWHPPVMAWLLGVAERIQHGAAPFVACNEMVFFGGLAGFATLERRPRIVVLPLLAVLMASPLVLIYQGIVWKDVLFANASMSAFAALAWAGKAWRLTPRRYALLTLAVGLFTLAALTRQNGFVVPVFGALALSAIAFIRRPEGDSRRWATGRAAVFGLMALSVVSLGAVLVTRALEARGDHQAGNQQHLKNLQVFDLAGAVHLDARLPLDILSAKQPDVERFVRRQAAVVYRPAGDDNISNLPNGEEMMTPPGDAVGQQWRALIVAHPDLYVAIRTRVFLSTLMTPASDSCPMVFTGVDGTDPAILRDIGISARYNLRDEWGDNYASRFLGTPVFSHIFYGALLVALLAMAIRQFAMGDRRPEVTAVIALAGAALTFAASFFVISIDCDYRFLYFLDVASMAALVSVVAGRPLVKTAARASGST
jgi:hypothetical protein